MIKPLLLTPLKIPLFAPPLLVGHHPLVNRTGGLHITKITHITTTFTIFVHQTVWINKLNPI